MRTQALGLCFARGVVVKIVQSGLANGHAFGMLGEFGNVPLR